MPSDSMTEILADGCRNQMDEKAGLWRDAVRSQVEAQEIKETDNEEG